MFEYGLRKTGGGAGDRKQSGHRGTKSSRYDSAGGSAGYQDSSGLQLDEDEEYLERFDSRGKKMKLRRGKVVHPTLRHISQSYSVVNFHPNSYITQKDLKLRATSVVYGKYKQIKREFAIMEQQRRLNWFRSIVIAKKFSKQLLRRAREKIEERIERDAAIERDRKR